MVVPVDSRQFWIVIKVVIHDHSRRRRPLPMCDRQQRSQRCLLALHQLDGDVLCRVLARQLRDFCDISFQRGCA